MWYVILYLCGCHGWCPPQRWWHWLFRDLACPSPHLWSHDAPAHEKPMQPCVNPAPSLLHQRLLHNLAQCILHDMMICIMYDLRFNRTVKPCFTSSHYIQHQYLNKSCVSTWGWILWSSHHQKEYNITGRQACHIQVFSKYGWECRIIVPERPLQLSVSYNPLCTSHLMKHSGNPT